MNELLRVVVCGSVDDGKSSLIGRLLLDTGNVPTDTLASLARDSAKFGTRGAALDPALLTDGLAAEREQGITIDVAWRAITVGGVRLLLADTPGHAQYTGNMATGASTADIAVLLVDATKGLQEQTHRHLLITALMGVRQVVLAVNKMDLVDHVEAAFTPMAQEFAALATRHRFARAACIPVSAITGGNIAHAGLEMGWYQGPCLLDWLLACTKAPVPSSFRLPVQNVLRSDTKRYYTGTVAGGRIGVGEMIMVGDETAEVAEILLGDRALHAAEAGQSVALALDRPLDITRGAVLAEMAQPPALADQFAAHIVWLDPEPLLPGRRYGIQLGHHVYAGQISELRHRIDNATGAQQPARVLARHEIGFGNISLSGRAAFDPYRENRHTGAFLVIDRLTGATAGCGMIDYPLRRAANLTWQATTVDQPARAALKGQKPAILWFTGLSGAGKSAIANAVEQMLLTEGRHTILLDGDNIRHGLNRDLGFRDADRVENIRRVAEVAKLMVEAGLIVLVAFISPFAAERALARGLVRPDEFLEIHVATPLAVCETRDPKGLYRKARSGELKNFTGIDSAYEPPLAPELRIGAEGESIEQQAQDVVTLLRTRQIAP